MSKWEHCPDCAFTAGHAQRCRYYGLTIRESRARNAREKAEKIARAVADAAWHATPDNVPGPQQSHDYHTALTARAAALQAMGEGE